MGYFDKFSRAGIPFMEGAERKKLDDYIGQVVHINDFDFIRGEDGDYAVIQLAEVSGAFFFANSIITDMLKEVRADGMKDELRLQGIKFTKCTSKRGREYMGFEFIN